MHYFVVRYFILAMKLGMCSIVRSNAHRGWFSYE
jgi:hypothetical protein